MIDLIGSAVEISTWLTKHSVPHFFIGGLAVQYWGEPRLTADVDLCVAVEPEEADSLVEKLLKEFQPATAAARDIARRSLLLPLRSSTGVLVEVALGFSGFEKTAAGRTRRIEVAPGKRIPICSAEDLIVYKIMANRSKDIADIETILLRQGRRLDKKYIRNTLKLLEDVVDDPDLLGRFDRMWREALGKK